MRTYVSVVLLAALLLAPAGCSSDAVGSSDSSTTTVGTAGEAGTSEDTTGEGTGEDTGTDTAGTDTAGTDTAGTDTAATGDDSGTDGAATTDSGDDTGGATDSGAGTGSDGSTDGDSLAANLTAAPKTIDFGTVFDGQTSEKTLTLSNQGELTATITDFAISGDSAAFEVDGATPVSVSGQDALELIVRFTPQNDQPAQGTLTIETGEQTLEVALLANAKLPCIQVTPLALHFGAQLVGDQSLLPVEVVSCGTEELRITGIAFGEGSHPAFTLDLGPLPGFDAESPPGETNPLVLAEGEHALINVAYAPTLASDEGPDGLPLLDLAQLVFATNTYLTEVAVAVDGYGLTQACPTAIGVIGPAIAVEPLTTLYAFGDQSASDDLPVTQWKWVLEQPGGSVAPLMPGSAYPNPSVQADLAGEYRFTLTVWDEAGVQSCVPWKETVQVKPDHKIYIELLWATPGDPDETDTGPGKGSDLDLHLTLPGKALGGPDIDGDGFGDPWFHSPFDCFWFSPNPDWGSFDPAINDNPTMLRTDSDGGGPEVIAFDLPADETYRVGVHHWDDHGYGSSVATLRVWVDGVLSYDQGSVTLGQHGMWDAVELDGATATVTPVVTADGAAKVTPNYVNPFFFSP